MRKWMTLLERRGKSFLLPVLAGMVVMHMIGMGFLFSIVWNSLVHEKRYLQEHVWEQEQESVQAGEQAQTQESARGKTQDGGRPWHWRRVSGGTFQELESLEEWQGGRRAADSYLGIASNFMGNGALKYKKYLAKYVYGEDEPKPHMDRDPERDHPQTLLYFWGTDRVWSSFEGKYNTTSHAATAFMNDKFYIEIPKDWRIGANDAAPLIFSHPSEEKKHPKEKMITYECGVPEELLGKSEEIDEYILAGGIEDLLENALGQEWTEEYALKLNSSGYFSLEKDGELLADIIVWPEIGQVVVRDQRNRIVFDRKEDFGRILLRQEWQDVDFSSPEAIVNYVESGGTERLTKLALGETGSWSDGTRYRTEFHEFLRFEGSFDRRQVTLYIPVTAEGQSNWVILFEAFEGSERGGNVYEMQEQIVRTFTLFPYYCVVREGDTLAAISRAYTGETDYYEEIASYPTNQIADPDMIYPGQKIEIPLGLRYHKQYYHLNAQ